MSGTINPALLTKQGPDDVPRRDAARYPAKFLPNGAFQGHEILVQLRLPANYGGVDNGELLLCTVLNDTGATIGSIYRHSDWDRLNVNNISVQEETPTILADGTIQNRDTVTYEMRLVQWAADGTLYSVSDWMGDKAVLVEDPHPAAEHPHPRLSGDAMRRAMFFLTSPRDGYKWLYVARTKQAMVEVLNSL